ncbi:hypothetical protein [Nocardioides sp.]|uniref:hypothetical protein n=1 Tax=Nocardioides sp. TaxID=35761 RepID=UPI003511D77F
MTDEPDLSPEHDAAVRRLLGEARHTDPIPEAVAARLDDVLRGLAETEATPAAPAAAQAPGAGTPVAQAQVVELAVRRRRAGRLLLAAAAIVVVGVGGGRLLVDPTPQGDATSAAVAEDARAGADATVPQAAPEAGGAAADSGADPGAESGVGTGSLVPPPGADMSQLPYDSDVGRVGSGPVPLTVRLTERRFARQVARLTAPVGVVSEDATPLDGAALSTDPEFVCDAAAWGPGLLVPVLYADRPAVLAFRAPTGDTQVVDLLQCGTGESLRSIVVATVG